MKKLVVMIGLAFIYLALVSGCSKDKKRICEAKGDNWYWDGADNTCKEMTDADQTQGTQGTDQTQGTITPTPEGVKSDYFILVIPPAADNTSRRIVHASIPDTPLLGVISQTETMSVVDEVKGATCVKVHKNYLSKLEVTVKPVYRGGMLAIDVCGGSETEMEKKCELGVYELEAQGSGLKKRSTAPPTDCKELKLEE